MERYNEYRYRKLFHCTHDEYLDTPLEDIEWMLHLDAAVTSAKRPQQQVVRAPEVTGMPTPKIG